MIARLLAKYPPEMYKREPLSKTIFFRPKDGCRFYHANAKSWSDEVTIIVKFIRI